MNLTDLAQGEPWMAPEERQTAAEIVLSLRQDFAARQIPETTLLILRVRDYLVHQTLCSRLDHSLMPDPRHSREDGNATPVPPDLKLAEQIGKSHDRLRRTLKELEDAANKLAPPPPDHPSSKRPSNRPAEARGEQEEAPLKGGVSSSGLPLLPFRNLNEIKDFIEEVGIDLNDPDFFADEDNFYDVPPYRRPSDTQPQPSPDAAHDAVPAPDPSHPQEDVDHPSPSVTPENPGARSSDPGSDPPSASRAGNSDKSQNSQPSPPSP